jgi:hypothetical protein
MGLSLATYRSPTSQRPTSQLTEPKPRDAGRIEVSRSYRRGPPHESR